MQTGNVTTPFGRRSMTLGMLASQLHAEEIAPDKAVDKWKIFRWLCEARERIGVSDRALAVLNALLSFHPKNEISEENGLVVFPSNAQLTLRTHGMTGTTLRRNLAQLVDAGLIIRKDSPNGKRYARKTGTGDISEAFGFSLAPLVARAEEIEAMATEIAAERQYLRRLKERLSLCRRDISKLIETALEEQIPGEWLEMQLHFRALASSIPRSPDAEMLEELLRDLEAFMAQVVNSLEMKIKTEKMHSNDSQSGRHIQNSNPNSNYESEPRSEKELGAIAEPRQDRIAEPRQDRIAEPRQDRIAEPRQDRIAEPRQDRIAEPRQDRIAEPPKSFPLAMVLQGCPEIVPYGPGGSIASWRDLMGAAVVVRSMLGVSPSAYQRACEVMGAENAATVIACLLERAGHINSVGGYLRDLTRRAEGGEFSIGPMLMALIRSNGPVARKAG